MKLYNVAYSGNSYKVRLLLAQLGISHEIIEIDILKGESRTAEFLKINPNGRTPALDDDGFILAESNAILAYLAKGTKFLPDERKNFGRVWQCSSSNIATSLSLPHRDFGFSTSPTRQRKPRCSHRSATAVGRR
jgi:glutathione S-transferase